MSIVRYVVVALLLLSGVSYFLPWYFWSSDATVGYTDLLRRGLSGLVPDLLPKESYKVTATVSPFGAAMGKSDLEVPRITQGPLDGFLSPLLPWKDGIPLADFGPRETAITRISAGIGGLFLILALVTTSIGSRRMSAIFILATLITFATFVLVRPGFPGDLMSVGETRELDLPGQFQVNYKLQQGVTPWFFMGMGSLLVATAAAGWDVIAKLRIRPRG